MRSRLAKSRKAHRFRIKDTQMERRMEINLDNGNKLEENVEASSL